MKQIPKLFVCIGAQKAGTTWLHSVLLTTGLFRGGYFKEIHYFDWIHDGTWYMNRRRAEQLKWQIEKTDPNTIAKWLEAEAPKNESEELLFQQLTWCSKPATDEWYIDMMTQASESQWAIDFSPGYATIGSAGFLHLKRLAKDLKLLFILRNPIDRSWSSLIHEMRFSNSTTEDPTTLSGKSVDVLWEKINSGNIPRYSNYLKTLTALQASGSLSRTKFLIYEQMRSDPKNAVSEILDFTDLDQSNLPSEEILYDKTFESPKIEIPRELREKMTEHYSTQVASLRVQFDIDTSAWPEFS